MPLYELFCLSRAKLPKSQMAEIIKHASQIVLRHSGVITDIKSFGEQRLAYEIRRPGERHSEAHMWQLTFAAPPTALSELDHSLRVDERIVRWSVLKRRKFVPLPNPYRIAQAAKEVENGGQLSTS
jgi:small subunit ribosomal protein S6